MRMDGSFPQSTLIVKTRSVVLPAESLTRTRKDRLMRAGGVPEIVPPRSSVNPSGKCPVTTANA